MTNEKQKASLWDEFKRAFNFGVEAAVGVAGLFAGLFTLIFAIAAGVAFAVHVVWILK